MTTALQRQQAATRLSPRTKSAPRPQKQSNPRPSASVPRTRSRSAPRAAARSSASVKASDPRLAEFFGLHDPTTTGVHVDEFTAKNHAAVYRAISLIASSIAGMPKKVYRRDEDDGRKVSLTHPSARAIGVTPDGIRSSYMFWESIIAHALTRGNGLAEIIRNNRGQGMQMHLLDPRRCSMFLDRQYDYQPMYRVSDHPGEPPRVLDRSQVFHIASPLSWDGLWGIAPVTFARESIGLGLAADHFGSLFFAKGGRPQGFLTKPNRLGKTERDQLREEFAELHEGMDNFWNVGVLSGGLDWKAVGISMKDAEFLSTRMFQILEVARWFGIPPHMLASMEKASYNNIESLFIEFVTLTLKPWVDRIEGELNLKMFTSMEQFAYYTKLNVDGLLRGDSVSRAESNEIQHRAGALLTSEWREQEDRSPLPNGLGNKPLCMGSQLTTLESVEDGTANLKTTTGDTPPKKAKKSSKKAETETAWRFKQAAA